MILYTLDTKALKKQAIIYLCISIFLLLFDVVYEMFSNSIYSILMRAAFLIPLIMGSGFSLVCFKAKKVKLTARWNLVYNMLIATTIMYAIIRGVLKIYGTANYLTNILLVINIILIILLLVLFIVDLRKKEK